MNEYDELITAIYHQAVIDLIHGIVEKQSVQSELSFLVSGCYGFDANYGKHIIDKIYKTYDRYTKIIKDFKESDIKYMELDRGDTVVDMVRALCRKNKISMRVKGVKFDHVKPTKTKICISKAN